MQANQIGKEKKETTDPGGELPRAQDEVADVRNRFLRRSEGEGALFVESTWQARKALLDQHRAHRRGAKRHPLFLERAADVVDGIVMLAQSHHLVTDLALLGLFNGPGATHREEISEVAAAEIVAEHAKRRRRVAEAARGLS
jgi:hypothetical protein